LRWAALLHGTATAVPAKKAAAKTAPAKKMAKKAAKKVS
jgi:hypothetical protein